MVTIDQLKFDEKGLIPAIVQDAETKKVLTLAYMNEESLKISMEKGLTCFWSRSRQDCGLKVTPPATTSTFTASKRTATGMHWW